MRPWGMGGVAASVTALIFGAVLSLPSAALAGETGAPSLSPPEPLHLSAAPAWKPIPAHTFVKGRVVRALVVDRGLLTITPPPEQAKPAVTGVKAASEAKASTTADPGQIDPAGTALGEVLVSRSVHATVQVPHEELAWVAVVAPQQTTCPPSTAATGGLVLPSFHVIVIAASGDSAYIYQSRGTGECPGLVHAASISAATEIVSIPWKAIGTMSNPGIGTKYMWRISYTVPPCGTIFDSPGIEYRTSTVPSLFVDATVPLVRPGQCAPTRLTTTTFGPEAVPLDMVVHAAVGNHVY